LETAQEILLDTSVLFSREFANLLTRKLVINDTVILEYLQVIIGLRDEANVAGDQTKARGREAQLRFFPQLVRENSIILAGDFSIEQVEQAANLILDRQVDPGDALIALWSNQHGASIATRDNDYDRLADICDVVKLEAEA